MRQTFGNNRHEGGDEVARQRVAHLDRRGQLAGALRQEVGQVQPGVLVAGEVQRHLAPLRQDGDQGRGVDRLGLGGLPGGLEPGTFGPEREDLRRGVVEMNERGLCGLAEQLVADRARGRHGIGDDLPLRGIGQRHVQAGLQTFEAVQRHAVAVTQEGEHAGATVVVFGGGSCRPRAWGAVRVASHRRQRSRPSSKIEAASGGWPITLTMVLGGEP